MSSRKLGLIAVLGGAVLATFWSSTSLSQSARPSAKDIAEAAPAPIPTTVCYAFSTVDQGQYSGFGYYCGNPIPYSGGGGAGPGPCYASVARPSFEAIIREECHWLDFWEKHTDNVWPPPPAPSIDFDKYVVIAVVLGNRPSGCYGVEINQISGDGCGRKIHIRERVPCSGELCTLAITNPFHYIKVCKSFLPFDVPTCFEHRDVRSPCNAMALCLDDVEPEPYPGPGGETE